MGLSLADLTGDGQRTYQSCSHGNRSIFRTDRHDREPHNGTKDMETDAALDLDAYRERIGYTGELAPTRPVLEALHLAHATHVPFENLDIQLGLPIRIDLDSLQAKL